jgi:bifunctional DNase/RNase
MIVARVLRRLAQGVGRGMLNRWPTTFLALALAIGGAYTLASRGSIPGVPAFSGLPGLSESSAVAAAETREMTIENIRPVRGGEQINLILKEKSGNRRLVMAVGQGEALAIASDLNRRQDGPMTYDLMRSLVQELGGTVNRVVVNNVTDTTFYAKVIMNADDRTIEVESRPSDAIALALRSRAPIFADVSVLEKAGVMSPN